LGETEAIIDLRPNGDVALAKRHDSIRPASAKRWDVKKILRAAAEHFDELAALWREVRERRE